MIPGMGAVATTLIAGVEAVRSGFAKPIGSITQMGTIRLGKRTDDRTPLIKDFGPDRPARRPRLYRLGHLRRQPLRRRQDRQVLDRDQLESMKALSAESSSRCPRPSISTT